jgi:hypothetical protein
MSINCALAMGISGAIFAPLSTWIFMPNRVARGLQAIELLRQLDAGQLQALPADADTAFVPAAWRSGSRPRRAAWTGGRGRSGWR